MIIEAFERAADDSVVAICNGVRHILPWSFVIDSKPQIGDFLHEAEGAFALIKQETLKVEEVIEKALGIEEPVIEPVQEFPTLNPVI